MLQTKLVHPSVTNTLTLHLQLLLLKLNNDKKQPLQVKLKKWQQNVYEKQAECERLMISCFFYTLDFFSFFCHFFFFRIFIFEKKNNISNE